MFVITSLASACVFAQSERGSITGVVTDSTGGHIASVPVVVINKATNTESRVTTTAQASTARRTSVPACTGLKSRRPDSGGSSRTASR